MPRTPVPRHLIIVGMTIAVGAGVVGAGGTEPTVGGGFPHTPLRNSSLESDDGTLLVQRAGPGPFGALVKYGLPNTGAETSAIEWEVGLGHSLAAEFLGASAVDRIGLRGVGKSRALLETEFAPPTATHFDIWVFDGDRLVGILENETDGSVLIDFVETAGALVAPKPKVKFSCGFKKGTYKIGIEIGFGMAVFGGGGGADPLVGDALLLFPSTPVGLQPPDSIAIVADGVDAITLPVADFPPAIIFGETDTAPLPVNGTVLTAGGVVARLTPGAATSGDYCLACPPPDIKLPACCFFFIVGIKGEPIDPPPPPPPPPPSSPSAQFELGGVESIEFELLVVNPAPSGACATFWTIDVNGDFGGSVQLDPKDAPELLTGGSEVMIMPDFGGIGSGTYTLQVYDDNHRLVISTSGNVGLAGFVSAWPNKFGKLGGQTPCYRMCFPEGTLFQSPTMAAPVPVSDVRLLVENAPPAAPIDRMEMRIANLLALGFVNPVSVLPGAATPCPADLNGDGTVDGADLGVLLNAWANGGPADLNGDGTVDGADLGILLNAWGPCP